MNTVSKTVQVGGVSIQVHRKTNLSEAKYKSLLGKFALFYRALATDLDAEPEMVDVALSRFARMTSQTFCIDGATLELPQPHDTLDTLVVKCRAYLLEFNPDITELWSDAVEEVNQSWVDAAITPVPLGEDAPKNS